jgi:hypothetical protein
LVGGTLFFLPIVFTISDARILFGLPSALFLFLLLAFRLDQFLWQEVRLHLARTLYSVAYYGMGLLLYVLVKRWFSSETIIFKNVVPFLVGCPLYFILAFALSRNQKDA